jgi:tryptophan synthase alpha chain
MAEGGCDVLEIDVPFSDPTADGPVIQRASERALRAGTTVRGVLSAVREARRTVEVPFVLFRYASPFLRYDPEALVRDAKACGADGFLIVDLPPEECAVLRDPAVRAGLDWIPLVAPTTPPARAASIAGVATSSVYLVSVAGVTGAGGVDLRAAGERAVAVSTAHGKPVAVGFGVSGESDARTLARPGADGIVVGSASDVAAAETAVRALAAELRAGARRDG